MIAKITPYSMKSRYISGSCPLLLASCWATRSPSDHSDPDDQAVICKGYSKNGEAFCHILDGYPQVYKSLNLPLPPYQTLLLSFMFPILLRNTTKSKINSHDTVSLISTKSSCFCCAAHTRFPCIFHPGLIY